MFTEKEQSQPMNPQQQQWEKLKELGSQIRQVREEQSISIDEVATRTRIQARLLVAIEEGNLDHLPEPIYIQGLIKQFAEALGLDGREYAAAFPTGPQTYTITPSWQQLPSVQFRPLHLYIIYALFVIGAISGLSFYFEQRSAQDSKPDSSQQQVVQEPVANSSDPTLGSVKPPSSQQTSQETPKTNDQTSPVKVAVSIKQDAWVRVKRDGQTIYQGILSKGETKNWTAQDQLTLRTGNAGGVVVEYNQQSPKPLGQPGQVKEVTYSPQN